MAVIKLLCCLVLALPLKQLKLTSAYGYRTHPLTGRYRFHAGVDLRANADTVYAVAGGLVRAAYDPLLGNFIMVSSNDLTATYGHLSQIFCLSGDTVSAGQPIAITGTTGQVTGEHLHFALRLRGRAVDPLKFLLYAMQHINKQ